MICIPLVLALVLGGLTCAPPPALAPDPGVQLRLIPERPVQGTIFWIELAAAEAGAIQGATGLFAGEPLHFERGEGGVLRALAAVPIDAADSLPLEVQRGSGGGPLRATVPVAAGNYRMERLTVAPRFGTPPDAATAARITAEADRARAVSRRSHETPRQWSAPFTRPRPGRVTSGFGTGREFNGQVQSRHMGTDFAGAVGAPVVAAADGVVALVDAFHLGGNVVYLDHGGGLVTAYLHLSEASVQRGERVRSGQQIGRVGATGRVTGPHLHWIVRYGSITVDPMSLLDLGERMAEVGWGSSR
jgi:murein DD-endopeptidase MepM/ murein hydrolase activator NlpD